MTKVYKPFTCYLAGPIAGNTFAGATTWRKGVEKQLHPYVKCLSPLRGMEYLEKAGTLGGNHGVHGIFSGDRAIMTRDFF